MLREDAAYIAGFLDGEGYITIRRSNRYRANGTGVSYRLVVGFTSTTRSILEWICEQYRGNINPKSRRSEHHSPAWELTIHVKEVQKRLLSDVAPFIRIKKPQLLLACEFVELGKVQRKLAGFVPNSRGGISPFFKALPGENFSREDFKMRLAALNQRGPQ